MVPIFPPFHSTSLHTDRILRDFISCLSPGFSFPHISFFHFLSEHSIICPGHICVINLTPAKCWAFILNSFLFRHPISLLLPYTSWNYTFSKTHLFCSHPIDHGSSEMGAHPFARKVVKWKASPGGGEKPRDLVGLGGLITSVERNGYPVYHWSCQRTEGHIRILTRRVNYQAVKKGSYNIKSTEVGWMSIFGLWIDTNSFTLCCLPCRLLT